MFENPRRGRQARSFTTNVPKILDLKSSSEQIFFRKLSLGAPVSTFQILWFNDWGRLLKFLLNVFWKAFKSLNSPLSYLRHTLTVFYFKLLICGRVLIFVKRDYGVERKDIYSILYLNRRAKVMKNSCFNRCWFVSQESVMVNFLKMLVETKNFAIYL